MHTVRAVLSFHVHVPQGLDASVVQMLSAWELDVGHAGTVAGLAAAAQPATTLRRLLAQLAGLKAPNAMITLKDWQWVPDLCAAMTDGLPSLTHLRFKVLAAPNATHGTLSDACMAAAVLLRDVWAATLRLDSEQWATTPWPWERLLLSRGLDVSDLLLLPDPRVRAAHLTADPHVFSSTIAITAKQVRSAW